MVRGTPKSALVSAALSLALVASAGLPGVVVAIDQTSPRGGLHLAPAGVVNTKQALDPRIEAYSEESGSVDLLDYAAWYGVSVEQAEAEIALVPAVASLELQLERDFSSTFAGIWIDHRPFQIVAATTAAADREEFAKLGDALGISVRVDVHDYAQTELLAMVEELRRARRDPTYAVRMDIRTNRIRVLALKSSDEYPTLKATTAWSQGLVTFERAPQLGGPAAIYGGLSITNGCTTGFSVLKNNAVGISGVLTAAHCDNLATYGGQAMPFQGAVNGNADAQWHTTDNHIDEAKFRTSAAGDWRWVLGRAGYANIVVGQTLCKYGTATHYGCGEVEEKFADAHWVPGQGGQYVSVKRCNTDLSTPGDSGGPVFHGNTAYGIVSGFQFGGLLCNDELVFGALNYAETGLGVTVFVH